MFKVRIFDELAAQSWQGRLATCGAGWAQKERASVGLWYRLKAGCQESADHYSGQNRDLRYQLCFRTYLHCRAPLGPGEFLLGLPVASALLQARDVPKAICDDISFLNTRKLLGNND